MNELAILAAMQAAVQLGQIATDLITRSQAGELTPEQLAAEWEKTTAANKAATDILDAAIQAWHRRNRRS